MATTSKGPRWEILHSLWIAWTFTLGFFNWVAFFYIGVRAKQLKWILWGLFYAIPFILAMAFATSPAFDGWVGDIIVALIIILGIIGIIHAFRIRKEYLLRLEALQQRTTSNESALRSRIDAESAERKQELDTDRGTPQPPAAQSPTREEPLQNPTGPSTPISQAPSQAPGVDLNHSSEQEIASLPGVGAIIAKRAVGLRASRGEFNSVEDFGETLNLKPHIVERIRPLVSVTSPQPPPGGSSGRIVDF